jgi:hypothetical protein
MRPHGRCCADSRIRGYAGTQREKEEPILEEERGVALEYAPPVGPNKRGSVIILFYFKEAAVSYSNLGQGLV